MMYVNAKYQDILDPRQLSTIMQDIAYEVSKRF